jgi:hypothetical protein
MGNIHGLANLKKYFILIITVMMLIIQSGCEGAFEMNEIGIVNTMAIDTYDNGQIKVSVLAAIPAGGGTMTNQPL